MWEVRVEEVMVSGSGRLPECGDGEVGDGERERVRRASAAGWRSREGEGEREGDWEARLPLKQDCVGGFRRSRSDVEG